MIFIQLQVPVLQLLRGFVPHRSRAMKRACVLFVVILSTLNNELLAYKKYIFIYTYICIIVSNIVMI